jgi:energy-converting hydrogenase Eha subunit C
MNHVEKAFLRIGFIMVIISAQFMFKTDAARVLVGGISMMVFNIGMMLFNISKQLEGLNNKK